MTDDLVSWLRTQLDEDEKIGRGRNDRPVDRLLHDFLHANAVFLARATTPGLEGDPFLSNGMAAHYAAAAAWLLNALDVRTEHGDEDAAELAELLEFGEPLSDWAGEQAHAYGIDVDKLIAGMRERETP